MKKFVVILSLIGMLSGCLYGGSTQTFILADTAPRSRTPTKIGDSAFFVYSKSGGDTGDYIDVAEICGSYDNVLQVQTRRTFGNVMRFIFTIGIYASREYRVWCKS